MAPQTHPSTPERMVDVGRGFQLCVQTLGDPAGAPLLLIHGLGQQLITWPEDFCSTLVDHGFFVIRFDNRDIGRSTHATTPPPSPLNLLRRQFRSEQYVLSDMAQDTSELLRALDVPAAHVVGISMGGMIAQTLAVRHPDQVLSLTSIMSSTGSSKSGLPARSTWLKMARRPPRTREAFLNNSVALFRHIGSHGFPFDEPSVRELAGAVWDRGHDPAGVSRQLAAIMKSGSRTREVGRITAPTLVLHGDRDRMVHPSGGEATAAAIQGSRYETIVGMGHDLPVDVRHRIADLIAEHARAGREVSA